MNSNEKTHILGLSNVPKNQIDSYVTNAMAHTPGSIVFN